MDIDFYNKWTVIFMKRVMSDFGLTVLDAAAIFGNFGQESSGYQSLQEKKPVVPGSRGGYGISQWTGPRRKEFEAYCKRNGKDPSDMNANYAFFFVELSGSEKAALPKLKVAKTLEEKTEAFMKGFLRPGIPHLDQRIIWAKRAYEAYQDANVVPEALSTPETPKPSPEPSMAPRKGILEIILDWLIDAIFRKN